MTSKKKNKQLLRKRSRPSESPMNAGVTGVAGQATLGSYADSVQRSAAVQPARRTGIRPGANKTLIGASSSSTIKASVNLQVPKSVFRLGNVDGLCSTADIQDYLHSIGVHVLTCFELPRAAKQPLENKAFRICILSSDKSKLLNEDNWSFGITIRPWVFKVKAGAVGAVGATGGAPDAAVGDRGQEGNEIPVNELLSSSVIISNLGISGANATVSQNSSVGVNNRVQYSDNRDENSDMQL